MGFKLFTSIFRKLNGFHSSGEATTIGKAAKSAQRHLDLKLDGRYS